MMDGLHVIFELVQQALIAPFTEFSFMRRALVATLALSLSAAPLGVFLTIRRMSLLGDALSHAVLPGVAIGFMLFGLSLTAMAAGGMLGVSPGVRALGRRSGMSPRAQAWFSRW